MYHKNSRKLQILTPQEGIEKPHVIPRDAAQPLYMHTPQMYREIAVFVYGEEHIAIPGLHIASAQITGLASKILDLRPQFHFSF
jgi:hypothetical protein